MRPAPPGFGASGSPQRGCECWRGCGDKRRMSAPRSWCVLLPVGALVPRELCLHRGCATHPELPAFSPAVLSPAGSRAPVRPALVTSVSLLAWQGQWAGSRAAALSPQAGSCRGAAGSSLLHAALCLQQPCVPFIGQGHPCPVPLLGWPKVSAKRSLQQPGALHLHQAPWHRAGTACFSVTALSPGLRPPAQERTGHPPTPLHPQHLSCSRGRKRHPLPAEHHPCAWAPYGTLG